MHPASRPPAPTRQGPLTCGPHQHQPAQPSPPPRHCTASPVAHTVLALTGGHALQGLGGGGGLLASRCCCCQCSGHTVHRPRSAALAPNAPCEHRRLHRKQDPTTPMVEVAARPTLFPNTARRGHSLGDTRSRASAALARRCCSSRPSVCPTAWGASVWAASSGRAASRRLICWCVLMPKMLYLVRGQESCGQQERALRVCVRACYPCVLVRLDRVLHRPPGPTRRPPPR